MHIVAVNFLWKICIRDLYTHIIMQAKVNNQGQIGLAYAQNLRTGVKLSLSGLLEGKNLNAGGHKLGVSLEFDS